MDGHNFNFRIAIHSKAMVRYNRFRFCYNQYLNDALNIRSRLICDRGWRLDEIGFGRHSNWLSKIAPRRMGLMPDFDLACWDFSKAGCFLNDATSPPRRPKTRICLSWAKLYAFGHLGAILCHFRRHFHEVSFLCLRVFLYFAFVSLYWTEWIHYGMMWMSMLNFLGEAWTYIFCGKWHYCRLIFWFNRIGMRHDPAVLLVLAWGAFLFLGKGFHL